MGPAQATGQQHSVRLLRLWTSKFKTPESRPFDYYWSVRRSHPSPSLSSLRSSFVESSLFFRRLPFPPSSRFQSSKQRKVDEIEAERGIFFLSLSSLQKKKKKEKKNLHFFSIHVPKILRSFSPHRHLGFFWIVHPSDLDSHIEVYLPDLVFSICCGGIRDLLLLD